ncbi:MAG: hypothetical protein K0B08_10505 [Bacteroidales bacterium]|nr:hypothetical protein [Bacteroidales bacterium]
MQSQEVNVKEAYDLHLEFGANYKIGDWLSGFCINGTIYSSDKRFSIASRNIILLKIERMLIDSINYSRNYLLSNFHTLNYIDFNCYFRQKTKHPFYSGIGIGWIYNGTRENYKQDEYGYGVISLTFGYKVTWFYIEMRGDIPFDLFDSDTGLSVHKLFPVTLGLYYRFLPKSNK